MATEQEVIDYLTGLSVIDLDALLKALEEKWNVKVGAAVATTTTTTTDKKDDGGEVQTEFTVVLKAAGANKINVIKVVREVTGLGLKDAKDLVDGAPKDVKAGVNKTEADEIGKKLKEAGAEVEVK